MPMSVIELCGHSCRDILWGMFHQVWTYSSLTHFISYTNLGGRGQLPDNTSRDAFGSDKVPKPIVRWVLHTVSQETFYVLINKHAFYSDDENCRKDYYTGLGCYYYQILVNL